MAGAVHGNINHAMRDNYAEFGVDQVAASYRNPFFPGIKRVVWTLMARWWEEEGAPWGEAGPRAGEAIRILDMAAGSGEATLCLLEWEAAGKAAASAPSSPQKIPARLPLAVQSTLPTRAPFIPPNARRRPPSGADNTAPPGAKRSRVFSGGSPPVLPQTLKLDIVATDPYTAPAYFARTSRICHPLSFADLAAGQLPPTDEQPWDIIICSFALHLLTEASELWALLDELSRRATWLVIVAPHKKPEIKETWGWSRWDMAAWQPAGEKLYAHGRNEEDETELEIVRDK